MYGLIKPQQELSSRIRCADIDHHRIDSYLFGPYCMAVDAGSLLVDYAWQSTSLGLVQTSFASSTIRRMDAAKHHRPSFLCQRGPAEAYYHTKQSLILQVKQEANESRFVS